MPDTKGSLLATQTTLATADKLVHVDISDTTHAASGTTKSITHGNYQAQLDARYRFVYFSGGKDGPQAGDSAVAGYTWVPEACLLPVNATGSFMRARVAATAQTSYALRKNGAHFGNATFAAAATAATFSVASQVTFAAGDAFDVVEPAVADATLADLRFAFRVLLTS